MAEHDAEDVAVFWDFACLPQPPRQGGEEEECFKEGLRTINFIYGSPDTLVCLQKQMPGPEAQEAQDPPTAEPCRPYADRGWCTFEEAVSSMVKPSARVLDLGMLEEGQLELCTKFRSYDKDLPGLTELCTAGRQPPRLPEDMASILARKTFTNQADCGMVAQKYRDFFELLCSIATELAWPLRGGAGWGLDEARQLARCLPRFTACKVLSLREHPWDDACVELMALAFPAMLSLRELWLTGQKSGAHFRGNAMGPDTVVHLTRLVPRMPSLRALVLPRHLRELEESRRLEEQWRALGKPQGASGTPQQARAEGLCFID